MLGIDYISAYRGEDTLHTQIPVVCPCYERARAKKPVGKTVYKADKADAHEK